ncbi:hypothetical protein SAMN05216420_11142 [Nitrosospira sp. Nl5]|uniref:hypothetical protein n=1 Tax=Nitrosospira sp. Nl5 TaxID=200120 RepID=UPI000890B622|nr:hypothetical protein [Nitrosospira sp. Nl5]SCY64166.1 hypothetical protein SAMN05216420_11142 [Nitrosospira sp. Nl5]
MQGRVRNGFGNGDGNKFRQSFHTSGSGDERKGSQEKGLILPGCMQAQMGGGIQMIIIVENGMLMGLKMSRWIKRQNMMLVIKLMRKYLAVKCPAKRVRQHTDKQHKHDDVDMAARIHGVEIVHPR